MQTRGLLRGRMNIRRVWLTCLYHQFLVLSVPQTALIKNKYLPDVIRCARLAVLLGRVPQAGNFIAVCVKQLQFKASLREYYFIALRKCYDVDDPKTWKTVCLKSESARNLNNKSALLLEFLYVWSNCDSIFCLGLTVINWFILLWWPRQYEFMIIVTCCLCHVVWPCLTKLNK